jgi:ABC-type transporter Mla subunit MlaD
MPVEKKHDFTKKEILAGALVLATAAVSLGFVALIIGWRPEKPVTIYHARFANTIGLKANADVRFGGMLTGNVTEIVPDPEERDQIRVTVAVDPTVPVNAESVATIEQISLTAEKHLEISTGAKEAPLIEPGGTMRSITKSGGFVDIPNMDGLISGSENLIDDLRKLLGVQEAMAKENAGEEEMASATRITADLRKLLGVQDALAEEKASGQEFPAITQITQDVRDLMGVQEAKAKEAAGEGKFTAVADITSEVGGLFDRYKGQLDGIVAKVQPMQDSVQQLLDQLNATLSDNRGNLDQTLANVAGITTQLNAEMQGLMEQVSGMLTNADTLTGDLSQFVATNRPVLENLLGDLGQVVQNLNVFMQEIKTQPQSIVWGKPAQGRKP